MATTHGTLASIEPHLLESMGRRLEAKPVALGPMPLAKDIDRRPLPGFGSLQIDQVVLMELNGWTGKQVAERLRVPASRVPRPKLPPLERPV